MAKQSGIGSALWWGSVDLSGDVGAVNQIETLRTLLEVTGIGAAAPERIPALRDGSLGYTAYWNAVPGQSVLTLQAMPRTDVQCTVAAGTQAVGSPAASLVAKQSTLGIARGQDGSLVASVAAAANGSPLEWGELLTTGKQTFASGTVNGTSVDLQSVYPLLTTTAFGAAAYLHVFSLGSGTPTVTVADSANDSTFAALSPTSLAFSPVAAGVQRLQTGVTATVRRYVRIQVTGTYTDLVCALNFVRYTEDPA
jgi:hypothetical protein